LPNRLNPFVIGIFALAAGIAAYFLFFHQNKISLNLELPDEAVLGESFPVEVSFSNDSGGELKEVKLSLLAPEGMTFPSGEGISRRTIEVGDLADGEVYRDSFELAATSLSSGEIEVVASYRPLSLNRSLSVSRRASLEVKPFLDAELIAPEEILAGEQFSWSLKYRNISTEAAAIKIDLIPVAGLTTDFQPQVLELNPDQSGELNFTAVSSLPDQSLIDLKIEISSQIGTEDYVISEPAKTIGVAASPLSLSFSLTNQRATVYPGEVLNYRLRVANNSEVAMENIVLSVNLKGEMYDFNTLRADGRFDSSTGDITWDASRVADFRNLGSGQAKNLEFSLAVKSQYPIRRINDKNFVLEAKAEVESPTVPRLVNSVKTVSYANLSLKVGGKAAISSQAFFRDAAAGILNSGPFPPRAGEATEFSVHWLVSDYATDLKNVEIRARLENGIELTDKRTAAVGELTFDEEKNEIVWKIPAVLASTGILNNPLQAVFQLSGRPTAGQVGLYLPLLGETRLIAEDGFTGETLSAGSSALTSELPFDKTVQPLQGIVR